MKYALTPLKSLQKTQLAASLAIALALCAQTGTAAAKPSRYFRVADRVSAPHFVSASRNGIGQAVTAASNRPATSITVLNCNDSGADSLRDVASRALEGDTVDMTSLGCSTITLTSGAITISNDIYITGPGTDALTISGNAASRVIEHFGNGTLDITSLTIANGRYVSDTTAYGGCIYSAGYLQFNFVSVTGCALIGTGASMTQGGGLFSRRNANLNESVVSGNYATAIGSGNSRGGGVYSGRYLGLDFSTISGNSVRLAGAPGQLAIAGGVAALGSAGIFNSTISGNSGGAVGGAVLSGSDTDYPMLISESTISGNVAADSRYGAGLYVASAADIANSTITGNTEQNTQNAKYGAGLHIGGYPATINVNLESSVVALNYSNSSIDDIVGSSHASLSGSHNFVSVSSLMEPPDTLGGDPLLGPLSDNGGPTQTHSPLAGSPLIDAGDNPSNDQFDQRSTGHSRVSGPSADIGAIETAGAPSDRIFADGFEGP